MSYNPNFDIDLYEPEAVNDTSNIDYDVKYLVATTENQLANMQRAKHQIESNKITNVPQCVIIDAVGDGDGVNTNTYALTLDSIDRAVNKSPSSVGINDLKHLHKIIVSNASRIDFTNYITAMGGNYTAYIKDGEVKLPLAIKLVIACDYTITLCRALGYRIGQLFNNGIGTKTGYIFNGKYWQSYSDGFIGGLLKDVLVKMGYDVVMAKTPYTVNLLLQTFWSEAPECPNPINTKVLINLNNATLEINADGKVMQRNYNRNDFLLYCLPYEYNPKAETPIFTKYLNRVLPDIESQAVLQELMGSVFVKNINLEKIGILYGSGANGKSVFMKIITNLLGKNNISEMDLQALTTDTNAANNRAQLMGKLLNFAPEINAKGAQAHDMIKRMASGEAIQVKLLYKDTITITDYAKMVFNANILPSSVELSHGYFRRFLIINFDQTIPEKERDLTLANRIIATELAGVLNWVVEGAKRLQQNKAFSACRKSEDTLNKYRLESDSVALFIDDKGYTPDKGKLSCNVKKASDLYDEFRYYALENGYHAMTVKLFAQRLRLLGFEERKGKPLGFYAFSEL